MILSVIIPIYNAQSYIGRLLECIIKQINPEIEYIFVDDGSSDESYNILCYYIQDHKGIKVYQQTNSGAASARQLGLNNARGKFVTFIDSDDVIKESYFTDVLQILQQPTEYDMYVLSYHTYFSEKNKLARINKNRVYTSADSYVRDVFNESIIGESALWNHIYNRDFLKKNNIRFDIESKIAEDCLFNDECMFSLGSVYVSDYAGYTWMCDHPSLTGRCPENMGETLHKHIENLSRLKEKYSIDGKENYILKVEASFFQYFMNNIQNAKLSKAEKQFRMKMALSHNISEKTIKTQYKGLQRYLLFLAWKGGNPFIYKISYWCDAKNIIVKVASKMVSFLRCIFKNREVNS